MHQPEIRDSPPQLFRKTFVHPPLVLYSQHMFHAACVCGIKPMCMYFRAVTCVSERLENNSIQLLSASVGQVIRCCLLDLSSNLYPLPTLYKNVAVAPPHSLQKWSCSPLQLSARTCVTPNMYYTASTCVMQPEHVIYSLLIIEQLHVSCITEHLHMFENVWKRPTCSCPPRVFVKSFAAAYSASPSTCAPEALFET